MLTSAERAGGADTLEVRVRAGEGVVVSALIGRFATLSAGATDETLGGELTACASLRACGDDFGAFQAIAYRAIPRIRKGTGRINGNFTHIFRTSPTVLRDKPPTPLKIS